MTGKQREAINIMKDMDDAVVTSVLIAQALGMNPGVLRQRVKEGTYKISKYDYDPKSGRIRFARNNFLEAIGEKEPDPDHPTSEQLLEKIWEVLMDIRILLKAIANE